MQSFLIMQKYFIEISFTVTSRTLPPTHLVYHHGESQKMCSPIYPPPPPPGRDIIIELPQIAGYL